MSVSSKPIVLRVPLKGCSGTLSPFLREEKTIHDGEEEKKVPSTHTAPMYELHNVYSQEGRFTDPMPFRYSCAVRRNGREYLEDNCAVYSWLQGFKNAEAIPMAMFAIMDGHSDKGELGPVVAERMRDRFEAVLSGLSSPDDLDDSEKQQDVVRQLEDQGTLVDESLLSDGLGKESGTTFSFALVTTKYVFLGNVGDSVGLCFGDENHSSALSAPTFGRDDILEESKIQEGTLKCWEKLKKDELFRLLNADIETLKKRLVALCEKERVEANGGWKPLAMSRAFGDFDCKPNAEIGKMEEQAIIARPKIEVWTRKRNENVYIGLFTDGVIFPSKQEVTDYRGEKTTTNISIRQEVVNMANRMKSKMKPECSLTGFSEAIFSSVPSCGMVQDNGGVVLVIMEGFCLDAPLCPVSEPKRLRVSGEGR